MAVQSNINFHQTFKPERQYISSILNVANCTGSMSIKDISSCTGIPTGKSSGKVEPHIIYANYMGLIEYEKKGGMYSLTRTKLGEIVYYEDPGLQENLSIMLCHCMILRMKQGADVWSIIFKKVLPMYRKGISKDLLLKELEKYFDNKINKKNFAPFLGSYEDMFSTLRILEVSTESIIEDTLQYNKEFIFLYAYVLWEYWNESFTEQDEISSIQLEQLSFGKAFGWDVQTEYIILEHLADKGLIRMNRQLMPYTILKLVDKDTLVERLYSELC